MVSIALWTGWSYVLNVLLVILLYMAIRSFLPLFHPSPSRWRRLQLPEDGINDLLQSRLWQWLFVPRQPSKVEAYAKLLSEAGVRIRAVLYISVRRMMLMGLLSGAVLLWIFYPWGNSMVFILFIGLIFTLLAMDKLWLESFGKYRQLFITREIYVISGQMLYYSGSRLNLHGKLVKCLPYTKKLRKEWYLLVHEWYEDPEEALRRFYLRLGTDEAYSFTETLNSLRQNESEPYYELLRQRIRDYKEKLDLVKESRNESFSYILFVLAGLPILNTFRVFILPWVEEGRKIFDSLN